MAMHSRGRARGQEPAQSRSWARRRARISWKKQAQRMISDKAIKRIREPSRKRAAIPLLLRRMERIQLNGGARPRGTRSPWPESQFQPMKKYDSRLERWKDHRRLKSPTQERLLSRIRKYCACLNETTLSGGLMRRPCGWMSSDGCG